MEEGFLVEVRLSLFRRPSESPLGKKTEREKEQTQMQEAMGGALQRIMDGLNHRVRIEDIQGVTTKGKEGSGITGKGPLERILYLYYHWGNVNGWTRNTVKLSRNTGYVPVSLMASVCSLS